VVDDADGGASVGVAFIGGGAALAALGAAVALAFVLRMRRAIE